MRKWIVIALISFCCATHAQQAKVMDSLLVAYKNSVPDTNRGHILSSIIYETCDIDPLKADIYCEEMISLTEELNWPFGMASAYGWKAYILQKFGDGKKAAEYNIKSMEIFEQLGRKLDIAVCYNNIAWNYYSIGENDLASLYYFKSLKEWEGLGETGEMAAVLNNLGQLYASQGKIKEAILLYYQAIEVCRRSGVSERIGFSIYNIGRIYDDQGKYAEALMYYREALEVHERTGNKYGMVGDLNSIGQVYHVLGKVDLALEYYLKGKELAISVGDIQHEAAALLDIGSIYMERGEMEEALINFRTSLEYLMMIDDKRAIAAAHYCLGDYYLQMNEISQSRFHLEESHKIAEDLGFPAAIQRSASLLYKVYKLQGDGMNAIRLLKQSNQMKDSLANEENHKLVLQQKLQFNSDMDALLQEEVGKERIRMETERVKRRNNLQNFIIMLVILLGFASISLFGIVKVPVRTAQAFIFVAMLVLFEFLLVYSDPYIDDWAGGVPIIKLLLNTGIAILILPIHQLGEKRLKKKFGGV